MIVVAENRIELAAQRHAADRPHVTPGSSTRRAPHALVRPRRVHPRRPAVVVLVVPVGAPFMHVRGDAEETEIGRLAEGHGPRRLQWTLAAIGYPVGHDVAPREKCLLPSARRELPFG